MKLVAIAALVAASPAWADDPPPAAPVDPAPPPAPPVSEAAPDPRIDELEQRIEELEQRDREREATVDKLEAEAEATTDRVEYLAPIASTISAYLDAGFFYVTGDGSGIRPDTGHMVFDEYRNDVPAQWVLMGDPLATAINSRGEPADLGAGRALTDDTIDSQGHPAFIASTVGLGVRREVSDGLGIAAAVDLLPRGHDSRFAIQTAMVTYAPKPDRKLMIMAGKIDSVLGVEYKTQDAPERITVTPSLACRYTCGRPIGVQVRRDDDRWSAAVSISGGDSFQQAFEPDDELTSSTLPTASARAAVIMKLSDGAWASLGASGSVGPQDRQSDDGVVQWHYGFDARLRRFHNVDATAEFVQGELPGSNLSGQPPCADAECLRYKAAYLLAAWRPKRIVQPYARIDWRDAVHQHGAEFVYLTDVMRVTAGVRVPINRYVMAKAEYTWTRELGRIPEFPDDVLTTSLVVSTD